MLHSIVTRILQCQSHSWVLTCLLYNYLLYSIFKLKYKIKILIFLSNTSKFILFWYSALCKIWQSLVNGNRKMINSKFFYLWFLMVYYNCFLYSTVWFSIPLKNDVLSVHYLFVKQIITTINISQHINTMFFFLILYSI